MADPKTEHISGTYRDDEVLLSVNRDTKLIVVQGTDGKFVSGWEMSEDQMASVLSEGRLY